MRIRLRCTCDRRAFAAAAPLYSFGRASECVCSVQFTALLGDLVPSFAHQHPASAFDTWPRSFVRTTNVHTADLVVQGTPGATSFGIEGSYTVRIPKFDYVLPSGATSASSLLSTMMCNVYGSTDGATGQVKVPSPLSPGTSALRGGRCRPFVFTLSVVARRDFSGKLDCQRGNATAAFLFDDLFTYYFDAGTRLTVEGFSVLTDGQLSIMRERLSEMNCDGVAFKPLVRCLMSLVDLCHCPCRIDAAVYV